MKRHTMLGGKVAATNKLIKTFAKSILQFSFLSITYVKSIIS